MALPSLADALIVIILLIPGFIAFTIIRWLGAYGSKLSEFQTSVMSFTFSVIILFFYVTITGLTDIDQIRDKFFVPLNYLILFGITLAVGFSIGIILKRRRPNYARIDAWQRTITKYTTITPWILVITKDNAEYKGLMTNVGLDEKRDVVMGAPKQIIRNDSKEIVDEIPMGLRLLFKDEDIARIVFLTDSPSDNESK